MEGTARDGMKMNETRPYREGERRGMTTIVRNLMIAALPAVFVPWASRGEETA